MHKLFFIALMMAVAIFAGGDALGQDGSTPRDRMLTILNLETNTNGASAKDGVPSTAQPSPGPPNTIDDKNNNGDERRTNNESGKSQPIAAPVIDVFAQPLATIGPDIKPAETELVLAGGKIKIPKIASFYLSAPEYLALRKTAPHRQTIYEFSVINKPLGGKAVKAPEIFTLILGPGYAALADGAATRLYDFRLQRLLKIFPVPGDDAARPPAVHFDNVSLYAKAYRNTAMVAKVTKGGDAKSIQIAPEKSLDSFWIESAVSWSAGNGEAKIAAQETQNGQSFVRNGQPVLTISGGDPFINLPVRDAFFAFAHHDWPLHPKVMRAFYDYGKMPAKAEIVTFGPSFPNGQAQIWTLQETTNVDDAVFPLPESAIGAAQRNKPAPLAFVIDQAARNLAPGGRASKAELVSLVEKLEPTDPLAAWLTGQRLQGYFGDCPGAGSTLCAAMDRIETAARLGGSGAGNSEKLADYITVKALARDPKTRGAALNTLLADIKTGQAHPYILRLAAILRAQIRITPANSNFAPINPAALLQQAIAKDPYDPASYLALAQVMAANAAFEQSWDIYDALRTAILTTPELAAATPIKISTVEANLRRAAPGYFLDSQ